MMKSVFQNNNGDFKVLNAKILSSSVCRKTTKIDLLSKIYLNMPGLKKELTMLTSKMKSS